MTTSTLSFVIGTGEVFYWALVRTDGGEQYYNFSTHAWEVYNAGHEANYVHAMTAGNANLVSVVLTGAYTSGEAQGVGLLIYKQSGGAPDRVADSPPAMQISTDIDGVDRFVNHDVSSGVSNMSTETDYSLNKLVRAGDPNNTLNVAPDGTIVGVLTAAAFDARLSNARAALIDKLNVTGNVASSAEVTAIQNNTRVVKVVPPVVERPNAGTRSFVVHLYLYDDVGNMEAPDASPTLTLVNQSGVDRSARMTPAPTGGVVTMNLVGTGHYSATYTSTAGDPIEQLKWEFSITEGGATRVVGDQSIIVDAVAVDFTTGDRTMLTAVNDLISAIRSDYTTARAVKIDNLDAQVSTRATPDDVQTTTGGGTGVGPIPITIEVLDADDAPVPFAAVSLTPDVGQPLIGLTGNNGKIQFGATSIPYTLTISAPNLDFVPEGITAQTGAVTISRNMTEFNMTTIPQSLTFWTARDGSGNPEAGVQFEYQLIDPPPGYGGSFDTASQFATSRADGMVLTHLMQRAKYRARRTGVGDWHGFIVSNKGTTDVNQQSPMLR